MSSAADRFNRSALSRFLNTPAGRVFRFAAGIGFLLLGYAFRHQSLGVLSMLWGLLPLTAGLFDVCYLSLVLGGPFSGAKIRQQYGR